MVNEGGAVICVTNAALAHRFADVPVVRMDADAGAIDGLSATTPRAQGPQKTWRM